MLDKGHKKSFLTEYSDDTLILNKYKSYNQQEYVIPFKTKKSLTDEYIYSTQGSFKLFF